MLCYDPLESEFGGAGKMHGASPNFLTGEPVLPSHLAPLCSTADDRTTKPIKQDIAQ